MTVYDRAYSCASNFNPRAELRDNLARMAIAAISGYKLVEILGEGPRATVYKARDPKSASWVVLKLFHTDRFENAESLLGLNHPHVVTFADVGRTESEWFTVTEYLPGGTLKARIRSNRLPSEQILMYAQQVAEALKYAHEQGVSHGNLKSENVMFSAAGALKLTDFDLAGGDTDLPAFGNLLYEMCTGRLPIPDAPMPPTNEFRNDLPAEFIQIMYRLLDPERRDRYVDSRTVFQDLRFISFSPTSLPTTVGDAAPSGTGGPALAEGRILSGRFKIVRFIARGGMGEVYEAEDLELREHVALKTVRPEMAGSAGMDRFKREIQLARKVTHPNVCRIFDLFRDSAGPDDVTFLTMELLTGETLHQRILRTGRISTTEALPIIRQMAAGLAAAHKAGVIHRDFKSSNVMLTRQDAEGQEFRVVVTDFGLARPVLEREPMTLSAPGDVMGTPGYMAPEQLQSGNITSAADIYAFGTVMYEMLAGTLPFATDAGLAAVLKRLQEPPASPRTYVPDLDDVWEATILRCLERRPGDRFSNADEIVKALTGGAAVAPIAPVYPAPVRPAPSRSRSRLAIGLAAVLVLALAAGISTLRFPDRGSPSELKTRRSVAVLGFKNVTGETDAAWLSTALAEMLTTELAAGEKVRAIPGENVARMSAEFELPESGSFGADTLSRIHNYLGADVVVYGSYVVVNGAADKIRVDLRLQDSVEGSLIASISEEGYAADLLALVSRGGSALREKLGLGALQPAEAEVVHAAQPATPEAARFYAVGLEKLRVFDALGAREALEKAIAEDGRHALARAGLATAWSMLGYSARAREQAQIALDLSTMLGREDQLAVEGRMREAALEWRQAVEVYRTLFGFFPDSLDYGIRLADAQTSSGDAKEALVTIEKLRNLPAPDRDNPRIDVAEARAAGALSEFKRQQSLAARAAARGNERGAKLLVAGAKLLEGSAFANLGELSRARAAFEEARAMYLAEDDRWDAANASTNLAYVSLQSGDLDGAQTIYEQTLAIYRQFGDRRGEATALTSIGTVFRTRGDFARARQMHEQALDIRRHPEVADRIGEATSLNNLANVLSVMGDTRAARDMYQKALPVFREIGDRNAVATVLSNLGDLNSEEGNLARARELYEEAAAIFEDLGNKKSFAYELSRLGDLDLIAGDLASARRSHEQALALRKQLDDRSGAAESQLALAQISLHEGNASSAEAAAKSAVEEFSRANRPDDEASALTVLARALLAAEKNAQSDQAIRRAEELSMKSSDRTVRLSVEITGASIRAGGDATKSMNDLERIVKEARTAKLLQLELEARLALAEIEIANGRIPAGRQRLDALQAEASQKGYKFIAGRAAAARRKIPSLTA